MAILRTLVMLVVLALPWTFPPDTAEVRSAVAIAQEQQAPAKEAAPAKEPAPQIDVNINDSGEKRYVVWLSNPVVLAICGVGVLLVVMLIVAAGRGGTTVIKE